MKAQMVKNARDRAGRARRAGSWSSAAGDRRCVAAATRRSSAGCWTSPTRHRGGEVVPPAHVVRHDGDDPYLVVAADKGTATFSRHRQRVAESSTASGSATRSRPAARWATTTRRWGSPRARVGVACSATSASSASTSSSRTSRVVGIGDMSGDVFGNGMLLSRAHPARGRVRPPPHLPRPRSRTRRRRCAERRRLFELPRSSWADYDTSLISEGGGIFPRTAKSIELSAAGRARRSDVDAERLTPSELIQAILRAPVDLLWNGGIGTYVKAASETHADVGDKANDARARRTARDLRARVVGEGGNLGFTQRGRIEFALGGGRDQHRRDRQRRRRRTAPTTRSTSRSCSTRRGRAAT